MTRSRIGFGFLLSSVFLADCSSTLLGEDVDSVSQAAVSAAGSVVAAQAVNGAAVGETPGAFSVTESGQASYTLPIWTPAGPMDVGPSLAMTYDSGADAGPLGVGFGLTGNAISSISRCQKTVALDGDAGPIDFTGKTYCLDGQRLIPISATEYRTEEDQFAKIVRITTGGSEIAPEGFIVSLKNGLVLTYGSTSAGRLTGSTKTFTCSDSNCQNTVTNGTLTPVTLSWQLEQVKDRAASISGAVSNGIGNYMKIAYTKLSTGTAGTVRYNQEFDFKEMLISRIEYAHGTGTTSHRNIVFTYGGTRSDARYGFVSGLPIMSTKLLTQIDVSGPNPTTTSLLRKYILVYETAGTTKRSRLKRFSECDAASVCKSPITFTWEDGKSTFLDVPAPNGVTIDFDTPLQIMDFNGDGKDDVLFRVAPTSDTDAVSYYRVLVSSMGTAAAGGAQPATPGALTGGLFVADQKNWISSVQLADFDRDGRSDALIGDSPGLEYASVPNPPPGAPHPGSRSAVDLLRNTGNSFTFMPDTNPGIAPDSHYPTGLRPMIADLDGDGLLDVIEPGQERVQISTGYVYGQQLYRMNTGGVLGARVRVSDGLRNYTEQVRSTQWEGPTSLTYDGYDSYAANIDGSGRTALLFQNSSFNSATGAAHGTTEELRAFYLRRTGLIPIETKLISLKAWPTASGNKRYIFADVNGDGMADAIEVSVATTSATTVAKGTEEAMDLYNLWANTGVGFRNMGPETAAAPTAGPGTTYAFNARKDGGVLVGDMNQDGIADIVLMAKTINRTTGAVDRTNISVLTSATGMSDHYHIVPGTSPTLTTGGPIPAVVSLGTNGGGPMPAQIGDFNGDGLLDMVAVPAADSTKQLHFYIHQGQKADLLRVIDSSLGAHTEITYASTADRNTYSPARQGVPVPGEGQTGAWEQPSECRYPRACLRSRGWVVSHYQVSSDAASEGSPPGAGQTLSYADARSDALRGWLGFAERKVTDDQTGALTYTTYDNITQTNGRYPYAMLPGQVGVIVRDNNTARAGDPPPHRTVTTNQYEVVPRAGTPSIYSVRRWSTNVEETILRDVPATDDLRWLVFGGDYAFDVIQDVSTTLTFDTYNNVTASRTVTASGDVTQINNVIANDPTNWLIGLPSSTTIANTTRLGELVTRNTSFTYETNTPLVKTEIQQPGGIDNLRVTTTYTHGPAALGQVTQKTRTATSTTDDHSVPVGTTLTRTDKIGYDTTNTDGVYPVSTTNALNQVTLVAYHGGLGVLAQTQDPNGVQTTFKYDTFGRLRSRTNPTTGSVTITHEAPPTPPTALTGSFSLMHPVYAEHTIEAGGKETIVTRNINDRPILQQTKGGDGQYRYVLTEYSAIPGQVAATSRPFLSSDTSLKRTLFGSDSLGRQSGVIFPDGAGSKYQFDERSVQFGTRESTHDPRNYLHQVEKDDLGHIVSVGDFDDSLPSNPGTLYVYGAFGVLKSVTPPPVVSAQGTKAAVKTMQYDILGRQSLVTDGDSGTTSWRYNAFGDVVKETDGNNLVTYFKVDALGRVYEKSNTLDGTTAYTWDKSSNGIGKIGKLRDTLSFDGTVTAYSYDSLARLSNTTRTINGRTYTIGQNYDASGRLNQVDYPTAGTATAPVRSVVYGYDAAGGVSKVTATGATVPYWQATAWSPDGAISKEIDATGMETTRAFSADRGWLDSIVTKYPTSGTIIQNVVYTHDPNGNIFTRRDLDIPNTSETFTYTALDQLKLWTMASPEGTWTTDYDPQRNGTIQQTKTGPGSFSMVYNYWGNSSSTLPHAVRSVSTGCNVNGFCMTPIYDNKGNETSTTSGLTIGYTSFDLPKTIANASIQGTYKYDANGARVYKDLLFNGTAHQTTAYVGGLFERRVSQAGVATDIVYVKNGSRVVAQETWTESGSTATLAPVLYLHDDILGSTAVTNTTTATTRLRYDPMGLRISPTNPTQAQNTAPTTVGFTGHEMDDEFGLVNMKGRLYDPFIGRFLTTDPLTTKPYASHGHDPYSYVMNNPMRYTDPSGFAMGTDPWLLLGYGQGFMDISWQLFGDAYAKAKRNAADKIATLLASQSSPIRDANGRAVGKITIVDYRLRNDGSGLVILVGFQGAGKGFNWVQTVWTNDPLGGQTSPYNDPAPGGPGYDNLPFYYTAAELPGVTGKFGFNVIFFDSPHRDDPSAWQGELSLVAPIGGGHYQILETITYGFWRDANTIGMEPIRIAPPSPFQRKSVP